MSDEKSYHTGGIESKLDGVATYYLIMSIFALVGCIVISQTDVYQKTGLSALIIGLGLGALAQGVIAWIMFQAGAESIRILKKLNGLPYAGSISEAKAVSEVSAPGEGFECTICHTDVPADAKVCPKCGAKFDD